jgi:hypothetical protein
MCTYNLQMWSGNHIELLFAGRSSKGYELYNFVRYLKNKGAGLKRPVDEAAGQRKQTPQGPGSKSLWTHAIAEQQVASAVAACRACDHCICTS